MSAQHAGLQGGLTQTTTVEAKPASKLHFLYVDNLRTVLITSVILLHLALTYGAEGDWYFYDSGETSEAAFIVIMPLAAIGSAFLLGLFFMLAGYFTPRSYDRKGFGRFLLERVKRLIIPLAFYEIVLNPLINYSVSLHDGFRGSFLKYLFDYFRGLSCIADGPVWFLLTLMFFSLSYALLRLFIHPARLSNLAAFEMPNDWMIALFACGLGVATFLVRIWAPVGALFEPWHQELANYPKYIGMFTLGIMAYRHDWLVKFPHERVRIWGWVALIFTLLLPALAVAAGVLTGKLDERGAGGWNWISFSYSMWEAFMCVAMSITVLGWFRTRFNHQGWLTQKMSETTFTAYVIHPVVIVPLAMLLSGIELNLGLKFLLVAPPAIVLTYVASYFFQRLPLIRNVF